MQITIIVNNHAPAVGSDPAQANHQTDRTDVIELTGDEWARRADALKSDQAA